MREILFRGKRAIDGEWVEGSLLAWPDGDADICTTSLDVDPEDSAMDKQRVDPATVEQYTGLKDKNGKRVFVGDILSARGGEVKMIVKYGRFYPEMVMDALEMLAAKELKDSFWGLYCVTEKGESIILTDATHLIEVIGNIHDNPELLKERGGA